MTRRAKSVRQPLEVYDPVAFIWKTSYEPPHRWYHWLMLPFAICCGAAFLLCLRALFVGPLR